MTGLRRPQSARQARAALHFALSAVARPNPLVVLWRWRYEIAGFAGVTLLALASAARIGPAWTLVAAITLAVGAVCIPEVRRLAIAQAWRIITPHRIRTGCAQAWIYSRNGRLPFIVFTTSRAFGERVTIWCRAGISVTDFASARDRLAAACWAHEVRIERSQRYAHIVLLDVIRRAPSEGRGEPRSPGGTADLPWLDDGFPEIPESGWWEDDHLPERSRDDGDLLLPDG